MAISYPVDPDSRWAVYDVAAGQVVARNKRWPRADGGELVGQGSNFVMLKHVDEAPPPASVLHDVVEGELIDVAANTIIKTNTVTPLPLADAKAAALAAVAHKRWEVETNHPTYDTSREAQAQINKAWMAVQIDPNRVFNYKAKDGSWNVFAKAEIEAIAGAISAWVEDCFDREKALSDSVKSATDVAGLESVLTNQLPIGWPT